MLHPANIPGCTPEMECLLDFQERLLEFSCRMEGFTQADLELEFGAEIATWLHANRQKLLDPLKSFSADISLVDKRQIYTWFQHDRLFVDSMNDPNFSFQFVVSDQSPAHIKSLKQLFVGYYLQLGSSGFHPQVCGHAAGEFDGRHWWRGFRTANPTMLTCSVCDASLSAGGKTIEHYFPKKQYPALSTHSSNLLPLCKICNNEIKREKDPLSANNLTSIYLPYHRTVRPNVKLEFSNHVDGGYEVKIEPVGDDALSRTRVENFEYLFDVSRRWTKELEDISVTAISRAKDYFDAMRDSGREVNEQTASGYLDTCCARMEKHWGEINYEYVATEWLRWAKDNKPALLSSLMGK